jgi:hypothetical protein
MDRGIISQKKPLCQRRLPLQWKEADKASQHRFAFGERNCVCPASPMNKMIPIFTDRMHLINDEVRNVLVPQLD